MDSLYKPNEVELNLNSLRNYSAELKAKNTAVIESFTALSNARIERNQTLYDEQTGLVSIAALVKSYSKGLIGADSEQFKQINSLNFTRQ